MWRLQKKEQSIIKKAEQVFCRHTLDWEIGFLTEPVFKVIGSDILASIYAQYDALV